MKHAAPLILLGVLAGGCGLRGSAPSAKPPSVLSEVVVQGRDGGIRVSWTANPSRANHRVESYDVLRRTDAGEDRTFFARVGSLPPGAPGSHPMEFVDTHLVAGETYRYRVRPRFAGEAPARTLHYSGPEEVFAWAAPPLPPADLKATPLHLAARLTWVASPGASGYRVYAVDSAGNASPEPISRGTVERTSWTAVALQDGRAYRFAVRAVLLGGRSADPVATPTPDAPPSPSGAEVSDAAAEGVSIPASDVGGALRKAASQLVGEGALPGIESSSSAAVVVTPGITDPPPPPHQLKPAITDKGIALSWRPSQGEEVVGYLVERRVADSKSFDDLVWKRVTVTPVVGSGWIDVEAKQGVSYEYRVRAVDASGTEGKPTEPTRKITFTP